MRRFSNQTEESVKTKTDSPQDMSHEMWKKQGGDSTLHIQTEEAQKAKKYESLGALAGLVAHDLNNYLGGICGYIDIAQENVKSGNTDGVVQTLSKALGVLDQIKHLTHQMLTFSKKSKPVRKAVVLSGLLKDTSIGALNQTNVKIVFDIFEGLWQCDIDERQIKMAIENIVVNAFQAMPGGGTIIVSAENVPVITPIQPGQPAEKYVRICICDQGRSIAKENIPRIFDPFFTTKKYGNGLGLAIAYSIVSKHNGIITVESEEGKGTAVFISLPASPSPMSMTRIPPCVTVVQKSRIKTLLMDDNKYIRDVASLTLQTIGHTVVVAADGNQAVELFARAHASVEPFDLVILDLIVPCGMGGAETIKKILSIDPAAIVIASSGNLDDPIMTNPTAFGFAGKIGKPYTVVELTSLLQQIMPSDRGESDEEEDYPGTGVMRINTAHLQSSAIPHR